MDEQKLHGDEHEETATTAPPVQTETDVHNQLVQHNQEVQKKMCWLAGELAVRGVEHDRSKFTDAEFNTFVQFAPLLKTTTYGDDVYRKALKDMKPALDHHYKANRHHPEHFEEGIRGMNLIDLIEMFCDWYASTERQKDGDIRKSIEANQKRFHFTNELKEIFLNTVEWDEKG